MGVVSLLLVHGSFGRMSPQVDQANRPRAAAAIMPPRLVRFCAHCAANIATASPDSHAPAVGRVAAANARGIGSGPAAAERHRPQAEAGFADGVGTRHGSSEDDAAAVMSSRGRIDGWVM
jgi:hypothetical protein